MKEKILIVEDDLSLSRMLQINLEKEGYIVQVAKDGPRALAVASYELPDLIILDVGLPGLDGFAVAEALKKDLRTRYIPIIMLTAYSGLKDKLTGFEKGVEDYIPKPFDLPELLARVRAVLKRAGRRRVIDELTGFPGENEIREEFEKRVSENQPTALIFIEVKEDYPEGKELQKILKKVSEVLWSVLDPEGEIASYLGGKRFALLTTPIRAMQICVPIIRKFERLQGKSFEGKLRVVGEESGEEGAHLLLAVVTSEELINDYREAKERAEEMLKKAKGMAGSVWLDFKQFAKEAR
jgi:CheY-like chemotaxis protein